jgi:CRISPR-associated endonuclease/helicase Cas3
MCTATQPALRAQDGFIDGLENIRELAPTPKTLYEQFRRVTVRHDGYLPDASIVQHLSDSEQVLCIVNNRRHARALYEAIVEKEGARHLTTLMCAKHRSEVLAEVRLLLKRGEACRLVSTSLIEAGVDVDFPKVLRAEAGLDSIAQAAGRCNREGLRSRGTSEVIVFAQDGTDWMPPPELKQYAQVFREIQRKYVSDPLHLDAITDYFKMLYWQKGALELDAHDLLGKLQRSRIDSLPFETLSAKFKMIESVQMPVIIPFDDEARDALRALSYAESCGGIARRLQPYIVQLPKSGYEALRKANVLQAVQPDRYGEQFIELINPDLYHERFGLHWDDPTFMRAESLVV